MDELRPEEAQRHGDEGERVTPWEARVAVLAGGFAYPPTPDLALRAPARRFVLGQAWAVAVLVVVMALALLAVPQVRAVVVRVFQLGVGRIFVTEPSPDRTEAPVATPRPAIGLQSPVTATPFIEPPPTALPGIAADATEVKPTPTPGMPGALADLAGRTTLAEAQRLVPFPIALPSYPPDLGPPDYVFVQEHAAQVLILAWSDATAKGGVGLSLWMFLPGAAFDKIEPRIVTETIVDGRSALWTEGAHVLFIRNGDLDARRLVLGNALIWERKDLTFRLETFLPLEEAVKVAESVR